VSLNALFVSILALITLLGVAGLVLSIRIRNGASGTLHNAVRILAIVEVTFLITVWTTAVTTGAIGDQQQPLSGHLMHLED
jgi:hypothetical protein